MRRWWDRDKIEQLVDAFHRQDRKPPREAWAWYMTLPEDAQHYIERYAIVKIQVRQKLKKTD